MSNVKIGNFFEVKNLSLEDPKDRGHANTYYSGLLQLTVVLY